MAGVSFFVRIKVGLLYVVKSTHNMIMKMPNTYKIVLSVSHSFSFTLERAGYEISSDCPVFISFCHKLIRIRFIFERSNTRSTVQRRKKALHKLQRVLISFRVNNNILLYCINSFYKLYST